MAPARSRGAAKYIGGSFLGALAVNLVLATGIPLGNLLAVLMPYMDPGMFGPIHPARP